MMWTSDTQPAPASAIARFAPRKRLSLVGDERLARLVKEGNDEAFAALYERYHQRLYRYCRSMLNSEADAQDALQSAFAGAYAALAEGRRDAPLRPWLYRIVHNESISILRRRRPEVALNVADELPTESVEDEASQRARLELLVADLGELAGRQRGALVMRELSGLSHEEIALALGISVGAAKQTIFEARQSLAEFAQGRAMDCDDICRAVSDGNGRVLRGRKIRAHLRDCAPCAAFAAAIPTRSRDLHAIAPPLSAFAAASVLRRALATGSGHGTGGAAFATGATANAATVALTAKTIAGVAIVVSAAVGVTGAVRSLERSQATAAVHVGAPRAGHLHGRRGHSHRGAVDGHSHSVALAVSRESHALGAQLRVLASPRLILSRPVKGDPGSGGGNGAGGTQGSAGAGSGAANGQGSGGGGGQGSGPPGGSGQGSNSASAGGKPGGQGTASGSATGTTGTSGNRGNHGAGSRGNHGSGNPGNHGANSQGKQGNGNQGNHGANSEGNHGNASQGSQGASGQGNQGAGSQGNHGNGNQGNHGAGNQGNHGTGNQGNHGAGNQGNGAGQGGNPHNSTGSTPVSTATATTTAPTTTTTATSPSSGSSPSSGPGNGNSQGGGKKTK